MLRRHLHRLVTTVLVVLSLLFSQLALANYICAAVPEAGTPVMEMAGDEPCEGLDASQPALCFQHCSDAPQNFDPLKLPSASVPAWIHALVLPPVLEASRIRAPGAFAGAESHAPPHPLFLSTLRLRV